MKNLKKTQNQQQKISDEDNALWQEVLKDVQPHKVPNIDLSRPEVEHPQIRQSVNIFEVYGGEALDYLQAGDFQNIDKSTVKRFKRGEFAIEARLDLHGCVVDEAFEKVENFIQKCFLKKLRVVQIITGKGVHRDESDIFAPRGVLKDLVPQWLNRENLRPLILTFDYSPIQEGGDGALLVLLRRARQKKTSDFFDFEK